MNKETNMNYETACMTDVDNPDGTPAPERWVREVLEPDQLTGAKMHYGRKQLSPGTLALLWTLRVYVVFMVCIIALAVWNALHAGG
jgi:hypothetical protein